MTIPYSHSTFHTTPYSSRSVTLENILHISAKHVTKSICNDYTCYSVERKFATAPLEPLPQLQLVSAVIPKGDKINLINLEQRSKLIKFPADAKPTHVTKPTPNLGCTKDKPVRVRSQRLPESPFPSIHIVDPDCALLRTVKLTRSPIKPCMTFTPPLTTPSEINLRPPTSIWDHLKSTINPCQAGQRDYSDDMPRQNSMQPAKHLFLLCLSTCLQRHQKHPQRDCRRICLVTKLRHAIKSQI
jgi:hypothetical protein